MDDKPSGRFSVQSPAQAAARSLCDLRSEAASARALLDMLERRLPAAYSGTNFSDGPTSVEADALAEQLSEELARLAAELLRCARRLAPGLRQASVVVNGTAAGQSAGPPDAGKAA